MCYDQQHDPEPFVMEVRPRQRPLTWVRVGALTCLLLHVSSAYPLAPSGPTTELSCNFGMAKGQQTGSCTIAVPDGCVVAHFPETTKPWSTVSKGGVTNCRFDQKGTNWKTRVMGSCDTCKTVQCTARFSVMVRCGG